MKKRNIYVILLLMLALVIWSHNAYQIFIGVTQSDQELETLTTTNQWERSDSLAPARVQQKAFVYAATFRDPFENWLKPEPQATPRVARPQSVQVEKPQPPRLRLSGIVRDGAGVLAIIEGPDGEIHFLKQRESLAGVKIVRIDSGSVSCEFDQKKIHLVLHP